MTRAKDISKIITDADFSGTLDVAGNLTVSGTSNFQNDITLSGASIAVPDNEAVRFGAGQDLSIFHDGVGGGSYINESGSGDLNIQAADIMFKKYGTSEVFADFNADGAVELYYDASKKFETTSTGIDVKSSGDVTLKVTAGGTSNDSKIDFVHGTTTDGGITFDHNGAYASEQMVFRAGNNTPHMYIDGAGRVGINVSPTAQFGHSILQVGNQATLGANNSLSTTGQTYLTHNLYYDTGGTLRVYNTGSANEGALLQMVDGQLRFSASDSTTGTPTVNRRLTVSKDGNLYVNTTSNSPNPGVVLRENGIVGIGKNNSNSGNSFMEFRRNATQIGSVTQSGTTGVSYNTSSDHRLKENVTADWDATTRLKQLNPVRFNFITDADTTVDGFLAHEVQSVVPEAITGTHNEVEVWQDGEELPDGVSVGDNKLDEDGNTIPIYQGIDQSKLVPLLTGALKEAIAKIEDLEARIATLEGA